ncbi:MAG: hypothetical protein JSV49_02465 [Thermoplasmata archaeon]|nr:MAG: hypothetical protein JSV49_02465 [Thermoplasmata archaeon]
MAEEHDEEIEAQKKAQHEIQNAEKKYQSMLAKRDELKEEAFLIRDERDLLNKEKKNIQDSIKDMRGKRDDYINRIKEHKKRRNEYQKQAKELIASKKTARTKIYKNLGGEIETVKSEIDYLNLKHQTVPMKIEDENALIDEIRSKQKNLKRLEEMKPEQDDLETEVMSIDEKIDQLFKRADKEHEKVVKLSSESQGVFDEIKKKSIEISHLINKANQKHDEYRRIMDRSGYYHERAMEMRKKVVGLRRDRRSKIQKARKEIDKQNIKVKQTLEDEKKLDDAADSAVKALLKKGKIEL